MVLIKDSALQRLKAMQSSKLGICMGYHLPIDILKGYLFCQKWYIKG